MPQDDYIPRSDYAFRAWLNNLAAKCEIYQAELGLSSEQLKQIQDYSEDFRADLSLVIEAKATLAGIVAGKDKTRKNATEFSRSLARQVKSMPNLPPKIPADLGVLQPSSQTQLATVSGLLVTGYSNGVNALKWNRGENAKGTIFLIEYRYSENSPWQFADAVTRTDYQHADQIPGWTVFYRVTSKRGNKKSVPSTSVIIYPGNSFSAESKAA